MVDSEKEQSTSMIDFPSIIRNYHQDYDQLIPKLINERNWISNYMKAMIEYNKSVDKEFQKYLDKLNNNPEDNLSKGDDHKNEESKNGLENKKEEQRKKN